ncbi:hypothetical protein ACF06D_13055 [Streptomyces griseoluteus]|uniref:hypothetical protein n=1 Tax=Streptomyces TaxID=1883 RepID=UPI0011230DFD|nr:hypothetical protein [Streptomyces recifensis]
MSSIFLREHYRWDVDMHIPPDPCTSVGKSAALPRTIDAVSRSLAPEKRETFLRALGQAVQGPELDAVFDTWWMEAMFDAVPGRAHRLERTVAGRDLLRLPDTLDEEQP